MIANVELEYQSGEKKKRAAEFTIANIEKDKAEENEIYLSKLNATKDKLFAIIAHDLHSPFNCILGLTEMLIGNFKDYEEAEVEEFLGNISFSAKHTCLARQFIKLGKIDNWTTSCCNRKISFIFCDPRNICTFKHKCEK